MNLLLILRHQVPMLSVLNREASFTAFQVRKMPMGPRTQAEIKAPIKAVVAPSLASLVPEMSTTQYKTKKRMETMAEVPSPPLRMRAPSGAPIKKRIRQARAWAKRLNFSTSARARMKLYSYASRLKFSMFIAICMAVSFALPTASRCLAGDFQVRKSSGRSDGRVMPEWTEVSNWERLARKVGEVRAPQCITLVESSNLFRESESFRNLLNFIALT